MGVNKATKFWPDVSLLTCFVSHFVANSFVFNVPDRINKEYVNAVSINSVSSYLPKSYFLVQKRLKILINLRSLGVHVKMQV